MPPRISVIVTAYNRREFLPRAVRSALNQTLPRDRYEVIVVKNFEDRAMDEEMESEGVTLLHSESPFQGQHLLVALGRCRGEIISFLDDDDEFLPRKLEAVESAFSDGVVFHRNRRVFVDARGRALSAEKPHPPATLGPRGAANRAVQLGMGVNSSSMSIRREALEAVNRDVVGKLWLAVDLLYFLAALKSGKDLVYDPRPLTAFRVHGQQSFVDSTSLRAYAGKRCSSSKKFVASYEVLEELAGREFEGLVRPLLLRSALVGSLFCPLVGERAETLKRQDLAYLLLHTAASPLDSLGVRAMALSALLRLPVGRAMAEAEFALASRPRRKIAGPRPNGYGRSGLRHLKRRPPENRKRTRC
ncbi:glycosyltransferase family 2 protein [Tardisphaera saccharovorans]